MRPAIATPRLLLRPLAIADAAKVSLFTSDPGVALQLGRVPLPNPVVAAEGWITIMKARAPLELDHVYGVDLAGEGLIGCVGLHGEHGRLFELGYWIGRPYWGNGYATEAAQAVVEEAAAFGSLEAWRQASNVASGRVLEKLGFAYSGRAEPRYSMARRAKVPCLHMLREQENRVAA